MGKNLSEKEQILAQLRKMAFESGITDKDKSAQIDTDKRVIDAQIVVLTYEGITRITTTIKKQAELNWDTVSRIITQRGQEVERMKRGHSVDGIRAPQYKPGINRPTRR